MTQMHMQELRLVGIDRLHLDSFSRQEIQKLCAKHVQRLRDMVGDMVDVSVHFKERHLPGDIDRFAITVDVSYPGGTARSATEDWYLENTLKHAFENVETQIENATLL